MWSPPAPVRKKIDGGHFDIAVTRLWPIWHPRPAWKKTATREKKTLTREKNQFDISATQLWLLWHPSSTIVKKDHSEEQVRNLRQWQWLWPFFCQKITNLGPTKSHTWIPDSFKATKSTRESTDKLCCWLWVSFVSVPTVVWEEVTMPEEEYSERIWTQKIGSHFLLWGLGKTLYVQNSNRVCSGLAWATINWSENTLCQDKYDTDKS